MTGGRKLGKRKNKRDAGAPPADKEDPYKDCEFGKLECYYKYDNGQVVICPLAPCDLSRTRFGTHERIIDYYLDRGGYNNAYYYFQDLLSISIISCDLDKMDEIREKRANNKKLDPVQYPLGCRVFLFSRQLKESKRIIKRKNRFDEENMSEAGKNMKNKAIREFEKKIYSSLDILKHLAIDERVKIKRENSWHKKNLDLYYEARRAHEDGFSVESGVGDVLEKGFQKAGKLSGLMDNDGDSFEKTKKVAEIHRKKAEKAKKQMEIDKIIRRIREYTLEGKDTKKLEKLLKELMD